MTATDENQQNGAPAGDPRVKQLFDDVHNQITDDVEAAEGAIDKIIDGAISGLPVDLTEAEQAGLNAGLQFAPPDVRKETSDFVTALLSQANPIVTANVAKGLHAAKAWIAAFAEKI